jgi:hypothetical protein
MNLTISTTVAIIALLISASAIYNAYRLRGGKLAWSEILIALGMISVTISLILDLFLPDPRLVKSVKLTDFFFISGFVLLFAASLKLRFSLK